ncbi:MAG TPA: DUF2723 domain-containing protein [Vicinamibacterales bacterium]
MGAAALLLFVSTLQPDFGGPEDTPKFQFIGYVLGIPHPPGYPLYVLLSHLFVTLPIGTIAYRANLFSAVMAAAACGLTYVIARQLGAARWSAACAAVATATGASFWRSAVFAEVYSLAAVLTAAIVSLLLDWGARGGTRRLLAAFGAFAIALGNHLTVVGVVPAFAAYVLTRGRRIWSIRMLAAAALLLCVGVGQYGLILIRTRQEAPYLEVRAQTLAELPAVVTAERYAGQRFAFSARELLGDHLPAIASLIARELGPLGVVLFLAGTVTSARRADPRFVLGAAAGTLFMIVNLSGDLKGFITPLMVLLWPFVALGADRLAMTHLTAARRWLAAIPILAAVSVPAINIAANHAEADQSGHTGDAAFFKSVFAAIPDGAAFVADDYWSDMAWHYYRFTGEAGRHPRTSRLVFSAGTVRDHMGEQPVFALARGATFLAAEGIHFNRVDLAGIPLDAWLQSLPRGSVLVGAAAYDPTVPELPIARQSPPRPPGRPRAHETFAVVVGRGKGTWRNADDGSVRLDVDAGTLGTPLPDFGGTVTAQARESGARVELDGHAIAAAPNGLALAVFGADGTLTTAIAFPNGASRSVPPAGALYRVAAESPCADLTTERWTDVAAVTGSGGWIGTMGSVGAVTIEMRTDGARDVKARSTSLLGAGTIATSVTDDVLTTTLDRVGEDRPVYRVAFDRPLLRAEARVTSGGAQASIRICTFAPVRSPIGEAGRIVTIVPDFESEPYFGAGWSDSARSATGPIRRGSDGATLLLPFSASRDYRVGIDLGRAPLTLSVSLNGTPVGTCDLRAGTECELQLPASAVLAGTNALTFAAPGPAGASPVRFTFRGARIQ